VLPNDELRNPAVATLEAAFARIAVTRMAGLPLNNPALCVATVGFVPWEDSQVGVLITPWAINLAAVSDDRHVLRLGTDVRRTWRFPSGEYELMGGEEPECGAFQFCSLFSPAFDFADQGSAVATAEEIMRVLVSAEPVVDDAQALQTARLNGTSVLQAPVSRRGFLRGVFGTPAESKRT
jgi:[NiFe] hydrogenase assembly HybE family chaperone